MVQVTQFVILMKIFVLSTKQTGSKTTSFFFSSFWYIFNVIPSFAVWSFIIVHSWDLIPPVSPERFLHFESRRHYLSSVGTRCSLVDQVSDPPPLLTVSRLSTVTPNLYHSFPTTHHVQLQYLHSSLVQCFSKSPVPFKSKVRFTLPFGNS